MTLYDKKAALKGELPNPWEPHLAASSEGPASKKSRCTGIPKKRRTTNATGYLRVWSFTFETLLAKRDFSASCYGFLRGVCEVDDLGFPAFLLCTRRLASMS